MTDDYLLEVEDLSKHFSQSNNVLDSLLGRSDDVQAVDGVSLKLRRNESQAVIGESGCGKTTLLMTLMQLYEPTSGTIRFDGEEVNNFGKKQLKNFRSDVQVIFQDPFNSLDPKLTVRETLAEPLRIHDMGNIDSRIQDICEQVELKPPEKYLDRRSAQLSGGEMQRVAIARALIVEPKLILADEPVSMLDVSTQASILKMLSQLINDLGIAMLYISHDISTVSYVSGTINVMYLGRIVERAPTEKIINHPKHPYTRELMKAIPIPNPHHDRERTQLEGVAGNPVNLGEGCRFADRCPDRMDICQKTPAFVPLEDNHHVACHLHYDHDQWETQEVESQ